MIVPMPDKPADDAVWVSICSAPNKSSGEVACTCIPIEGYEAKDARGCLRHPILARLDEEAQ